MIHHDDLGRDAGGDDDSDSESGAVAELAERLAELADVAELMGDADAADRLRRSAARTADRAMRMRDD